MATSSVTAVVAPSSKSFLQKLGDDLLKVLGIGVDVAEGAEPVIDLAVPAIAAIYNSTVSLVKNLMATATAAKIPGGISAAQVSALAVALEPIVIPYLTSVGVSNPTTAQIEAYINSVIQGLSVFEVANSAASTTSTAPTVVPGSTMTSVENP
jgi:hypothetical protein